MAKDGQMGINKNRSSDEVIVPTVIAIKDVVTQSVIICYEEQGVQIVRC